MKVCAHFNLSPYQHSHGRYDSLDAAAVAFKQAILDIYGVLKYTPRDQEYNGPTMDVYPQCNECNSLMNFHDYPMARYQIGVRGGIRKVSV